MELGDDELCESELASFSTDDNPIPRKFRFIVYLRANQVPRHSSFEETWDRCGEGHDKGRRTTYRMATAKRLNIEESKDLVALEDLEGRDIP